jgi:hypothetical protein
LEAGRNKLEKGDQHRAGDGRFVFFIATDAGGLIGLIAKRARIAQLCLACSHAHQDVAPFSDEWHRCASAS